MSKERLYWVCQISGWLAYTILMWGLNRLDGREMNYYFFMNLLVTFVLGVGITHLYRTLIIRLKWLKLKIVALIPRVILTSIFFGFIYCMSHIFIYEVLVAQLEFGIDSLDVFQMVINLSVIYVLWSFIYFFFHYIQNYRKEGIKNLRWQALTTEVELNKLKSQLNPHFIFNSMNSIRALVDENPEKAKDSITQLSNILRGSLLMGREKVVSLSKELQLVQDYLSLEQTRFEERLKTTFDIASDTLDHKVPPMLLQTLVENGIKHGISTLAEGGELKISTSKEEEILKLRIENTGFFRLKEERDPGFGLLNSRQRLFLLYGNKGGLTIFNTEQKTVVVEVLIPERTKKFKTLSDKEED